MCYLVQNGAKLYLVLLSYQEESCSSYTIKNMPHLIFIKIERQL